MTTDDPDDGIISFTELYCRHKGFEHVSLARPSATNFAIRLQMEKAIEERADFLVIGITCSDRFDVAIDTDDATPVYQLDNIHYSGYRARSEKHVNQRNVKLVSDTFVDLQNNTYRSNLTDQKLQALKSYIAYLHTPTLAVQKEYFMLSDGLRKLQQLGIEFVLIPGWMGHRDWSWVDRVWPKDQPMPYNMPYGPSDWNNTYRYTGTHNPSWAHEEFCQTLKSITTDWT